MGRKQTLAGCPQWVESALARALESQAGSTVAFVALTLLGLGAGMPLLILGVAATYVVRFLEAALRTAANVTLVGSGIDQSSCASFQ